SSTPSTTRRCRASFAPPCAPSEPSMRSGPRCCGFITWKVFGSTRSPFDSGAHTVPCATTRYERAHAWRTSFGNSIRRSIAVGRRCRAGSATMSPSDKRDWSGLLYLPGEELVRSTIDGDDADWSESLSYVPSDALVRTVLDAPHRERPTIRMPATVLPQPLARHASNRRRWTAALLAGLGFSPFSLAAAAVFHLAFLLAIGPWILTRVSAVHSIQDPRSPAIVATRLVYIVPRIGDATRPTPARKPSAGRTTQPPLDTTNSGAAPSV